MVAAMANNGLPLSAPPAEKLAPYNPVNLQENGREYHSFRKGKYMFPCDEEEKDRMDIYHKLFSVARREKLHSPHYTLKNEHGTRILDLGCGTGIWAIDMAEMYWNAIVHGVDLAFIQPSLIPPNCSFGQRDVEEPWQNLDLNSWDLIHMRMLNGSVMSWPDTYQQIFRHLKPGTGWMEHVEIDLTPRSDDGSLPPNSQLVEWSRLLMEATARSGRPLAYNTNTRAMLEEQGFTEIQDQTLMIPFNAWPSDTHLKDIGRWYHLGLTQGLEALTLAPLTRMLGWKKPDVDRLVADCKREICMKRIHAYCNMHIWIARRPAER